MYRKLKKFQNKAKVFWRCTDILSVSKQTAYNTTKKQSDDGVKDRLGRKDSFDERSASCFHNSFTR